MLMMTAAARPTRAAGKLSQPRAAAVLPWLLSQTRALSTVKRREPPPPHKFAPKHKFQEVWQPSFAQNGISEASSSSSALQQQQPASEAWPPRSPLEVEEHIREVLEEAVVPNVQLDGGDCHFHSYDPDTGVVTVELAGACVDCSSSTVTLRFMIKNVVVHLVPEVTNVVRLGAEEDDAP